MSTGPEDLFTEPATDIVTIWVAATAMKYCSQPETFPVFVAWALQRTDGLPPETQIYWRRTWQTLRREFMQGMCSELGRALAGVVAQINEQPGGKE